MKGCSDVYQCCTILPNFYNVIVISLFFFGNESKLFNKIMV